MAKFVYIDETGSTGRGSKDQPVLWLVAAIVDEAQIQDLRAGLDDVAWKHLQYRPRDLEFHGVELWNARGYWATKSPAECLAAYEDAIAVLDRCDVDIAHSSIHKERLHVRYDGGADENAYLLALQFLLEKVDRLPGLKVLVADEAKEAALRAVRMVGDMQEWAWGGLTPGRQLESVIDSLHFVQSHDNAGVQMADLVAFILQRYVRGASHPDALAGLQRMRAKVGDHQRTWRSVWP